MSISKIKNYLLLTLLFLLPWQTRLIYSSAKLGWYDWEYGNLSLYGIELLLATIILFALIEKFRDKKFVSSLANLSRVRLVKVILGVGAVLSLYLFVSLSRNITWQYLNWVIYAICLAVIIVESKIEFKIMAIWLWSGAMVEAFGAISQFFNQSIVANKWLGMAGHTAADLGATVLDFGGVRYLRSYGSFGSPNSLGIYLAAVFLLGIILLCHSRLRERNVWMLLFGQNIILLGLFFSFARGAWLATCLGVIILIWKNFKNKLLWKQLFVYGLVMISLLVVFKPLIFSRVDFQNRLEIKSISERVEQLQDFKTIFSRNMFFGVGPGVYTYGLFNYQLNHQHDYQPVHNIYLLFLGEWGIVGLLGLLTVIFYLHKRINWLFVPLISVLIAGLFDHWTLSMFTGIIFLAILIALAMKYSDVDTISIKE